MITVKAPNKISGKVVLPSSKSICNRALVINSLAGNKDYPKNLSDCDDTNVMVKWLSKCPETVNIGAAGTAMRFSSARLAVMEGTHIITGSERMKNRPIGVLVDALRNLGAQVEYVEKEGFPPLRIKGNPQLEGGEISLPGNVSSQYISALLMIAPMLKKGLRLVLTDKIVSRPYINMTLSMMREFGANAYWASENSIVVEPVPYIKRDYFVESDWSAASYWYQMVALAKNKDAEIVLPGLFAKSLQGDAGGAKVFEMLGVKTVHEDNDVKLTKSGNIVKRLDYDFVEMPDLAQTFVVTCCMLNIPFHFTGLQTLEIKETNRIKALKTELAKLGYYIEAINGCELKWNGKPSAIDHQPSAIDTYEDHRMALAFAPLAFKMPISINNPQVVTKSYPHYWDDLKKAQFTIQATIGTI